MIDIPYKSCLGKPRASSAREHKHSFTSKLSICEGTTLAQALPRISASVLHLTNHKMPPKSKSAKQTKQIPKPTTAVQQQPPPNWPPLTPVLPADSLTLESLLPNQILTVSNLWTSTLCAKYVAFLRSLPLATTPGIPKKGDAVRVNDRFQIDDATFAQRLWSETGLSELVGGAEDQRLWGGEVLGLNPNIRIYRYSKGQFFDQHCTSRLSRGR